MVLSTVSLIGPGRVRVAALIAGQKVAVRRRRYR